MWSPTHVQVVVQRAKGLLTKGKNKSNDCFVTIALGKEKYQTSVKEKASENVEWHEECELQIPQQGNTAEIVLTALHRNFLGVDEFLGTVRIPLAEFDVYEMPKNRWYELSGKPGKESSKERGKLEVRIGFIVRAGSLSDLTKKERHKRSLGQLSSAAQSFGGSLLSIGSLEKRKGLKKLAKSIGSKVKGVGGGGGKSRSKGRLDDICDEDDEFGGVGGGTPTQMGGRGRRPRTAGQEQGEADPGVVSDEEDDFTFDDLSHKSSTSSLNSSAATTAPSHHQQLQQHSPSSSSSLRGDSSPQPLAKSDSFSGQRHRLDSGGSGQASPRPAARSSTMTATTAATTSPPSKPPRFALTGAGVSPEADKRAGPEDEWGQKLYGLQTGNALKRWENKRMSPKIIIDDARDTGDIVGRSATSPRSSPVSRLRGDTLPPLTSSPGVDSPTVGSANRRAQQQQQQQQQPSRKDGGKEAKHERPDIRKEHHRAKERIFPRLAGERIIIGGEERRSETSGAGGHGGQPGRLPSELAEQFEGKSREDLIEMVLNLQLDVADKKKRLHDLEDYIDALLLRVIECSPRLLQNPYQPTRRLSSPGNQ